MTTEVDEKGRRRRTPPASFQTTDDDDPQSPGDTAESVVEAAQDVPSEPVAKKSRKTKRTVTQAVYDPPVLSGSVKEPPPPPKTIQRGIYTPIVEGVVALNAKTPTKWAVIDPAGRRPTVLRDGLIREAEKRSINLEVVLGEENGIVSVYARVVREGK